IFGYGSQGHAHANNLKDSGAENLIVALRPARRAAHCRVTAGRCWPAAVSPTVRRVRGRTGPPRTHRSRLERSPGVPAPPARLRPSPAVREVRAIRVARGTAGAHRPVHAVSSDPRSARQSRSPVRVARAPGGNRASGW
ncbi:MAG: hypothetical protein JKZ02_03515, partial [Erythrobacter sp.]|nr:hypothetical protein [Erythrobacter sp.]